MGRVCEECGYCRWTTCGDGWNEPRESFPDYCAAGHEDKFDYVDDPDECEDFREAGDDDYDNEPDCMDLYKQRVEDEMLGVDEATAAREDADFASIGMYDE